jgi:hypothetical protein
MATAESINASVHDKALELLGITLDPVLNVIEEGYDGSLQQSLSPERLDKEGEDANNSQQ